MEICRLCLLNNNHYINIFDDIASNKNVAEIIGKHVGEVTESDPLPNHVCIECWTKIENFHDFYASVRAAQARYLSDLVKYEAESNHFVDVFEPVDLNIDTSNAEPVDVLTLMNDEQHEATMKLEYEICQPTFIDETSTQITHESTEYDEILENDDLENKATEPSEAENETATEHSIKKISNNKKQYICDICSHSLTSKQKIIDHLLRHLKYVCPICSKRCLNRFSLNAHVKAEHYKDKLENAKHQLDALRKYLFTPDFPDVNQIQEILREHYDSTCDYCTTKLPPSLEQIQGHYNRQHAKKGYLKCCNRKLETINHVNEHVIFHLYPDYYRCYFCDLSFVHGNVLKKYEFVQRHITKHLTDVQRNTYICIVCRAGFISQKLLDVHRKYHHGIDESNSDDSNIEMKDKKYNLADFFTMRCDLCDGEGAQFATFLDAKQHYRAAHEISGYLVCCGKRFQKPKTIDDHFRYHTDPDYLKCQYCGKCFNRKILLSVHVSKHRAKEDKRFSCPKCNKAFHSGHYLKKHLKTHDIKIKNAIPCPSCHKTYTTKQSLEYHIKYAHNKDFKGVICEICGKQFVSKNVVQNHVRIVHCTQSDLDKRKDPSKRSQCTMCNASFINKYRLKKHIDTIHLSEPVKCELCDKVAPNPAALVCHMKSVHVAQNFQCHLCSKAFKAATALKDHIATHTGEKMYKCSFCPEAFIWRPNMYSHQKKAHPNEWKSKKSVLK